MNWLNDIADKAVARQPEGEILIESGGSPSGVHHFGHMRELVTCDAILLELRRRGRQAKHIYFVDDLDVFRKVPVNVPAEWEKYLGMPICDVPAPDGSSQSYADYNLQSLIDGCKALNVEVEFIRSHPKYRIGWFVPAIELVLANVPTIKETLEELSNRVLPDDWNPVQIVENGRLKNRKILSIDTVAKTVVYVDGDGQEQQAHYDKGEVKMDWRVDWPARWWLLKPVVEPFGREHASAGGSYDTGAQLMKQVFKTDPPLPVPYDSIHMLGDTKKMSASKGTAISAPDAAKLMPAEVLRYFILRAPLNRPLNFDPSEGVVRLVDEYAALVAKTDRNEFEEQLLNACARGGNSKTVSRVPFSHLIASYQASLKNPKETIKVIERTEHGNTAKEDAQVITHELRFIDEWLQKYAPDDVKFSLAEQVNLADFSDPEKAFLQALGQKVAAAPPDADGNYFHERMYELKDQTGLQPKELFAALYKALIGKTSGPRAGWFLSILPRDWLVKRLLLEDAKNDIPADSKPADFVPSAQLTDDVTLIIDPEIHNNFPEASIGYVVAELPDSLSSRGDDPLAAALATLQARGVTAENLSQQPEITVWRAAFKTFGVKASDYLCSAEALAKRALKGKPAEVSPIVDAYNAVSLKYLVPMGALDLDKLSGDLSVRYGHQGDRATLLGMDKPVEVTAQQVVYADSRQVVTWLWNHRDAVATAVRPDSTHVVFLADSLLGSALAQQAIDELEGSLHSLGVSIISKGVVGQIASR